MRTYHTTTGFRRLPRVLDGGWRMTTAHIGCSIAKYFGILSGLWRRGVGLLLASERPAFMIYREHTAGTSAYTIDSTSGTHKPAYTHDTQQHTLHHMQTAQPMDSPAILIMRSYLIMTDVRVGAIFHILSYPSPSLPLSSVQDTRYNYSSALPRPRSTFCTRATRATSRAREARSSAASAATSASCTAALLSLSLSAEPEADADPNPESPSPSQAQISRPNAGPQLTLLFPASDSEPVSRIC
jgi:hypothetical protein